VSCPSCLRAQQIAAHRDYREGCTGCGIRELAHMPADKREQALDVLEHHCGTAARARVVQELRVEVARIKKLRGERVKEMT